MVYNIFILIIENVSILIWYTLIGNIITHIITIVIVVIITIIIIFIIIYYYSSSCYYCLYIYIHMYIYRPRSYDKVQVCSIYRKPSQESPKNSGP